MIALALLSASLIPVAADDAALQPSAPADIASAVGDCWQAVIPAHVDRAHLGRGGWSEVAATSKLTLQVFTKPGANHRIFLTHDPVAKDYCTVIARLSSKEDAGPTLKAVQQTLKSYGPNVTAERTEGGVAFVSSQRFAQIDATDAVGATEQQPALRIIVGYKMAEKK